MCGDSCGNGTMPAPSQESNKKTEEVRNAGNKLKLDFGNSYVDRELKYWIDSAKNEDSKQFRTMVASDVMELSKVLNKQGHSGESWKHILKILRRVEDMKPLAPLTGEESEWGPAVKYGNHEWQSNLRCNLVVRDPGKNETARYIDAYIVSDNGGHSWYSGNWAAEKFGYPLEITFPYNVPSEPERIYIKYSKEVPAGEMDRDAAIDMTGNETEIQRVYDEYEKRM